MRIDPPATAELEAMMGPEPTAAWRGVTQFIDAHYEKMETQWHTGGKAGPYELKYRRGGKTLCSLFPRQGNLGFMVVLGRAEQAAFEAAQAEFAPATAKAYNATTVYHDGRWLMLEVADGSLQADMEKLLAIKRRPSR